MCPASLLGGAPPLADRLPHPPEPVQGPGPPGEHAAAPPHQPRPHVGVGVAGGQAPRHQARAQLAVVGDAEISTVFTPSYLLYLPQNNSYLPVEGGEAVVRPPAEVGGEEGVVVQQ